MMAGMALHKRKKQSLPKQKRRRRISHFGMNVDDCAPMPAVYHPPGRMRGTRVRSMSNVSLSGPQSPHYQGPPQALGTFYTFMVQNAVGRWSFVYINSSRLCIYDHPRQMFARPCDAMREVWQRAVIDLAVNVDEMVDISTLRLVKVNMGVEDASEHLFHDKGEQETYRKMAAVAKLTDREAKLLNLAKQKAMLKLYQAAEDEQATVRILDRVTAEAQDFSPGSLFRTRE